ncbi:uncharacterized protein LOC113233521, partial [Hyposmocoma kahamanoa]|uniref:uncharacterized protein LOC113233521 n=1 Tax=Hyposmocoma kahamanoa TaxID=1477025 RepID=UPI000E6D941F
MSLGKIEAFDVTKDNWNLYIDRLEQYFLVNDVKDTMKVPTLITVIGSEAYELMDNLCTPVKLSTKKYSELVELMRKQLQPKPSLLAERSKFRQRVQKNGECVVEYVTELKKLSKDCQFTAETLKENLRDQFVCGLRNENITQRLFAEDNVSFDDAFKIAVSIEAAEKDAALVEEHSWRCDVTPMPSSSSAVHRLTYARARGSGDSGARGAAAATRTGQPAGRYDVRTSSRRYVSGSPIEPREADIVRCLRMASGGLPAGQWGSDYARVRDRCLCAHGRWRTRCASRWAALDDMVRDGIISPVTTSDWATPIVPIMKKDGTIRVCADFKVTLNKCLEVDRFPVPKVEDLLA